MKPERTYLDQKVLFQASLGGKIFNLCNAEKVKKNCRKCSKQFRKNCSKCSTTNVEKTVVNVAQKNVAKILVNIATNCLTFDFFFIKFAIPHKIP